MNKTRCLETLSVHRKPAADFQSERIFFIINFAFDQPMPIDPAPGRDVMERARIGTNYFEDVAVLHGLNPVLNPDYRERAE